MTYDELVAYLDRVWIKSSVAETVAHYPFEELRAFLAERGDPHRDLTVVHVTGSKGKGSVATLAADLLRAHALPTGTYTSPHLTAVEERVGLGDGAPIGRDELAARMSDLLSHSRRLGHDSRSILRLFLVAAIEAWRDAGTRHAVVEVGIGGRFDHTNILDGQVACVTPIGLEHVPRLGRSLAEIAAQKVAIVKPGRTCVSAPQSAEVASVVRAGVALANARLVAVSAAGVSSGEALPDSIAASSVGGGYTVRALDAEGVVADLLTPHRTFDRVRIGRLGRHQAENAAVALAAVEETLAATGRRLEERATRSALASSRWPARLELLRVRPPLVYDGAHTVESAAVLARALADHFPDERWTLVVGMLTRRDAGAIFSALAPVARRAIAVPIHGFDAIAPEQIAAHARAAGLESETADSVAAALSCAGPDPICVAGTLYLYEAVRAALAR